VFVKGDDDDGADGEVFKLVKVYAAKTDVCDTALCILFYR